MAERIFTIIQVYITNKSIIHEKIQVNVGKSQYVFKKFIFFLSYTNRFLIGWNWQPIFLLNTVILLDDF